MTSRKVLCAAAWSSSAVGVLDRVLLGIRRMSDAVASRPAPRIGCSGWNYKSWKNRFYPAVLPPAEWLRYYVTTFDTVETNASFYRLPEPETFAAWRAQTPDGFVMAVKASRYLTHLKQLRDPEAPVQRLLEHASALGPRLGPILYQLPARISKDLPRLDRFLAALPATWPLDGSPRRLQHVIEFRDPSWYTDDVFARLANRGVAVCLHDRRGSEIAGPAVGPFTYVRFHGTSGEYHGSYGDDALDAWADRLAADSEAGRHVYAYFNNDPDAVATSDARRLRDKVQARVA
jgi:uncharacterized protein YecE (DUF72 family)